VEVHIGDVTDQSALGDGAISELIVDFSETARILFSAGGVADTLVRVAELAVSTIDGCDYAGLFFADGSVTIAPISTHSLVDDVDAVQQQSGEGPAVDAVAQQRIVYSDDLGIDARWTRFGPRAASAGIRSLLALPLVDSGGRGSLNLYARYPTAFGVVDRGKAVVLASLAGVALSAAQSHEDEERRYDHLHEALRSREVIGQAEGILMERERITADQAFDILRRASQHLNRKLREVAQTLVDTGEEPETGASPPA